MQGQSRLLCPYPSYAHSTAELVTQRWITSADAASIVRETAEASWEKR